ncbi:LysR family transcriptional regulator [Marinibaculum pumilum]|uniref:LysR family transcriptional regulator n=1 Tax=Marinibaculum pumilum TaxID=1766165 RepID=A0ABV7L1Y1_9PROT
MNTVKLRHAVAVDRAGSFSAAAAALSVTQSTVTRSVAELERDLGHLLFERGARGATATPEGRDFLERAARIVADLDMLAADARSGATARRSLLRIGVCPPSVQGLVNHALRRLIAAEPSLCVQLSAPSVERGAQQLRRGDIDLLVGPQSLVGGDPAIATAPAGLLRTKLFARRGHPLTRREQPALGDLADYKLIVPDLGSHYVERFAAIYAARGKEPLRHLHVIEYFPIVADLVASTDLLAMVEAGYERSAAFRQRFVAFDLSLMEPVVMCCAHRARWLPGPPARAFMAALAGG